MPEGMERASLSAMPAAAALEAAELVLVAAVDEQDVATVVEQLEGGDEPCDPCADDGDVNVRR
jgi:hypothetical protein